MSTRTANDICQTCGETIDEFTHVNRDDIRWIRQCVNCCQECKGNESIEWIWARDVVELPENNYRF